MHYEEGHYKTKQEVVGTIEKRLGTKVGKVIDQRGRRLIIACKSLREKTEFASSEKFMKGSEIWLRDEKTRRELEVERWIRKVVKWEQYNGKVVEAEGLRMRFNGKRWVWDDLTGEMRS